jgi:hypothetical protein
VLLSYSLKVVEDPVCLLCASTGCSRELWPEKGMNQAIKLSTALNQKTSLLHDIESIDSLQNHAKSFMGCIKIICGDGEAMAWLFYVIWSHELWAEKGLNQFELSTALKEKNQSAS